MIKHICAGVLAVLTAEVALPATAQTLAPVAATVTAAALAQYGYDDRGRPRDTIECGSRDYKFQRCRVPWRDAQLIRQTSDSACVRDRTWGMDHGGIWVDKGCGGTFAEARRGGGYYPGPDGWRPGPGWDTTIRVRCASQGYKYNMCQVDTGRGSSVRVERQISNTRCEQGRTWGYNRAGIWVDGGCEAVFRVDRRWR